MSTQSHTVSDAGKDIASKAKGDALSAADDVKDAAANRADAQAENTREAGAAFEDGSYARQAANQISDSLTHVAANLRNADLGSLHNDVAAFARRNPLLFFGGAALVGFAAGRVLKASVRAEHEAPSSERHDDPGAATRQSAYPDREAPHWGSA